MTETTETCERTKIIDADEQSPSLAAGQYRLVVIQTTIPALLGRSLSLVDSPLTIGRDDSSVLALEEDSVSRRHASLIHLGEQWWVEDHGSTNGTFVDGERLDQRQPVESGAKIRVGETVLKLIRGDDAETRYFERSYRLSVTDPLTGAYNRRFLEQVLLREASRARRHERALSLLMIDVDHFKRVNDRFGHPAGDAVLREMVELIGSRLRVHDLVARFGGEEFTVILPEATIKGARVVAEGLRRLVEEHSFRHDGHTIPVTISVGCASRHGDDANGQAMLARADKRLYQAKKAGRNRVMS